MKAWQIILILVVISALIYMVVLVNKANAYKASQKVNGQKCILSMEGNGVWLNGVCVSNSYYIQNTSNLTNSNNLPNGATN